MASINAASPGGANVPGVDLANVSADAIALIPRDVAVRRRVVPVESSSDALVVAMSAPSETVADDIRFLTGRKVQVVSVDSAAITEALRRYYQLDGADEPSDLAAGHPEAHASTNPERPAAWLDRELTSKPHSLAVDLRIWCPHCAHMSHVRQFAAEVHCVACGRGIALNALLPKAFNARRDGSRLLVASKKRTLERNREFGGSGFEIERWLEHPRCPCGSRLDELDDALKEGRPSGAVTCRSCGVHTAFRAPDAAEELARGLRYVIGESRQAARRESGEAITLKCSNCGATLKADGASPIVKCEFCGASEALPSTLRGGRPQPEQGSPLYLVFDPDVAEMAVQHYADSPLEDRLADAKNPATPPEALEYLAKMGVPAGVRTLIARNSSTPEPLLIHLAESGDDELLDAALARFEHDGGSAALGKLVAPLKAKRIAEEEAKRRAGEEQARAAQLQAERLADEERQRAEEAEMARRAREKEQREAALAEAQRRERQRQRNVRLAVLAVVLAFVAVAGIGWLSH